MKRDSIQSPARIAILIPCYNEAVTIEKVILDLKEQLPDAQIYVYDNNSSDDTADLARSAGAVVVSEKKQGKGFVVRSMFRDIDADVYVMVDGDDTYPASRVLELVQPVLDGKADMVVGNRLVQYGDQSFRRLHVLGNRLVVRTINAIFGSRLKDVMSGYRAFSREFVKSVPVVSRGFEIETELTLQALYRDFVIHELPVVYGKRPEGSHSKLRTFRDGTRVMVKIVDICKAYRPLLFFALLAGVLSLLSLTLGALPMGEFLSTGRIEHMLTAVLASGVGIIAVMTVLVGLMLDSINHHFREQAQLILNAGLRRRAPATRPLPHAEDARPAGIGI